MRRLKIVMDLPTLALYVTVRASRSEPFGPPRRIDAFRGHVETVTVAPGGCAVYFHERVAGRFVLRRAERLDCPTQSPE